MIKCPDMVHECEACVSVCIDFRFQEHIRKWIGENLDGISYDLIAIPGSVKDLETLMKYVEVSKRLHHINQLMLINHEDCGAYGGTGTLEKHTQDLKAAKEKVEEKYPDITVGLYYMHLDGKTEKIR